MLGGNTCIVLYYLFYFFIFVKGEGCYLWDVDGYKYIDFVGEMMVGFYGYLDFCIIGVVKVVFDNGIMLGGQNIIEVKFVVVIVGCWFSVEWVRFCNLGTEVNLMSINVVCVVIGCEKLMVFEGSYYGGVFYFCKGGLFINVFYDMVIGKYNDVVGVEKLIVENGPELVVVIVEFMVGGVGCILVKFEFL